MGSARFYFLLRPIWARAFGVGDQGRYQLQNVLFRMDIGKGVVMVTFLEIDGVQDFVAVLIAPQRISALRHDTALRVVPVKIENRSVAYDFRLRNYPLSHHHASAASSCPPRCPCSLR